MLTDELMDVFKRRVEKEIAAIRESMSAPEIRPAARETLRLQQLRYEAAARRLKGRTYGLCCDCADVMELTYLELDPAVPFCPDCLEYRQRAR